MKLLWIIQGKMEKMEQAEDICQGIMKSMVKMERRVNLQKIWK